MRLCVIVCNNIRLKICNFHITLGARHIGVSVSYDTILRGMLTPTEMRTVLKQRENDSEKLANRPNVGESEAAKPTTDNNVLHNSSAIVSCS